MEARSSYRRDGPQSLAIRAEIALIVLVDINPEFGDGRGEAGQNDADDHLVVTKDGFVPDVAAPGKDRDMSLEGINDPVFEQSVGKVLFALGLVIAVHTSARDDFGR